MPKELPYLDARNSTEKIRLWKKQLSYRDGQQQTFSTDQSALLVIDMQHYFMDEDSHAFVPTGREILPNVQSLIEHFRREGRPIIFTYFAVADGEKDPIYKWWGGTVKEGSKECAIASEITPKEDEKIIRKKTYSSFYGTKLEEILRKSEIQDLVITGVLTNLCCEEAAREAFCRGFNVFFMMDATASFNEEMHLASLQNISYSCATILATTDILQPCTTI